MTTALPTTSQAREGLPRQTRLALVALIVGGMAAILDSTMVTLAISKLTTELHSTTGDIQWVTTIYLLAMAVAIPFTGWLEARIGGRNTWMLALVGFMVASALCAAAWNAESLIAFRAVQGLAGGLIMPLMMTLAVRASGGQTNPRLMASVTIPIALGPILGPVIGGAILGALSWRWLFLVNVPVVIVGLILAVHLLPDDRMKDAATKLAQKSPLDVVGLILLVPGLVGILYGLSELARLGGVDHVEVLVPLCGGIVLLVAFVVWAAHARNPLVDVRLLRLRSLGSAAAVMFTAGAALYAGMFLLPLFYQQLRGQTVLAAGLLMIPQGVGALASRFLIGGLIERFGARAVTIGSFLLAALATVPFAFAGPQTNLVWLSVVLLVRGLGIGAVLIPAMSTAYVDVPASGIAHASMATRITQQVGGSFGTAVVAVVLEYIALHSAAAASAATQAAFHGAFWWAIGITVLALIPALAMQGRRPQEAASRRRAG